MVVLGIVSFLLGVGIGVVLVLLLVGRPPLEPPRD